MPRTCRLRSAQGGLFDVPRSRMAFGSAISWPFFVLVKNCEFHFSVQNAKFRDFVRFLSKANFLCRYTLGTKRARSKSCVKLDCLVLTLEECMV